MFSTALEDGEIITKISFPIAKKAAYEKFKHPASGFALVGVFVSKRGSEIRVAVTGAGANGVFRVKSFEEALKKRFAAKSLDGMEGRSVLRWHDPGLCREGGLSETRRSARS